MWKKILVIKRIMSTVYNDMDIYHNEEQIFRKGSCGIMHLVYDLNQYSNNSILCIIFSNSLQFDPCIVIVVSSEAKFNNRNWSSLDRSGVNIF